MGTVRCLVCLGVGSVSRRPPYGRAPHSTPKRWMAQRRVLRAWHSTRPRFTLTGTIRHDGKRESVHVAEAQSDPSTEKIRPFRVRVRGMEARGVARRRNRHALHNGLLNLVFGFASRSLPRAVLDVSEGQLAVAPSASTGTWL